MIVIKNSFVFKAFEMSPIALSIAVTIPNDGMHGWNIVKSWSIKNNVY